MPVMVKDGRAVLFVHIPKTGGTTIERLFLTSGWEMHFREGRVKRPDVFRLFRCSPQHYHAALLDEMFDISRFDVVFCMFRDPVTRFQSEFAMRHKKLAPEAATPERVATWSDRVLASYGGDPYILDNHLRPQTEFVLPGTQTYRLEDGMEAVVADLNGRFDLGLDAEIPHQRSSEKLGLATSKVQLSPALLDRVHTFYAADAVLGYPAAT
jgi:hypothetical protein